MWDVFFVFVAVAAGSSHSTDDNSAASAPSPAALIAEDQTPTGKFTTATEVKPSIALTDSSWVAVREWDGTDLVYVTHLWAWRCGLAQMEVSINDSAFEIWPLPPCHVDTAQPNGITDTDGLPYREFGLKSVDSLGVKLTFDDLTTQEANFERKNVLLP
jgi:hypothetical protein